jgi:hypothetical protein
MDESLRVLTGIGGRPHLTARRHLRCGPLGQRDRCRTSALVLTIMACGETCLAQRTRRVDDSEMESIETMNSDHRFTRTARDRRTWGRLTASACAAAVLLSAVVLGQPKAQTFPLTGTAGLREHNVTVVPATLAGRQGVRVTMSEATQRRIAAMPPQERQQVAASGSTDEQLALIEGVQFGNGTIEAEIAGAPRVGASEGARGFVGLAFRVQSDLRTYDAFYLRPTNGRADDQVRRNHSAQYISHPDWPWFRLRKETPEKYEAYVDLVPATWTKVRIEVRGSQARLYVHDQPQPTLVVSDLKTGATATGGVALWIDVGTEAHFRNLIVTPGSERGAER